MTVVRDRKIQTALRTNQIAEFVTVTAWKKMNIVIQNLTKPDHQCNLTFIYTVLKYSGRHSGLTVRALNSKQTIWV